MGIASIEDMLIQFGYGQLTHVDLHEEAPGLVPNNRWKRRSKGLPWYPGDTLITAIGQGFMLASPLQMANATAAMSQKGIRFRPHLMAKSIQSDNEEVHPYTPLEEYPIKLKDDNYWNIIAEAMHSVITNNEGTGYRFGRNAPYSVAAKTGTAQVFSLPQNEKKRLGEIPEYLRDHSLFIAFAPVETRKLLLPSWWKMIQPHQGSPEKFLMPIFNLKTGKNPHEYEHDASSLPFYFQIPAC